MQSGKKALDQAAGAWQQSQPSVSPGAGPAVSSDSDTQLAQGQHDRTYNPVDGAPSRSVSSELNSDAARYKKGPGPL